MDAYPGVGACLGHYGIRMAIPYRTGKIKSANIFTMVILGPTAKFKSRQNFWRYGMEMAVWTEPSICIILDGRFF